MRDLLSQLLHKTGYMESYIVLMKTQYINPISHYGKADLEAICTHTKLLARLGHWKELVSSWFEIVICPEMNQEWD